ncbi:ABC transporter substrate-binding protein [Candidatus Albibeggiatoa sp. nov. NOAA]|uniref:MlaC/ttg2D family ABC transporter substrate-binding protein n=1 Tax=Candidatus Albibeggiatoa sp. nov. NOAA TaxID=3162724 RepID=UPI0032FF4AF8|nr:ABC transporter substrate-binding protein [Thiotrichaceae bacterium]
MMWHKAFLIFLFSVSVSAFAQPSLPPLTPATEPRQVLQQGLQNLLTLNRQVTPNMDRGLLLQKLEQDILPYFDFNHMARWVIGHYRQQATPSQMLRLSRYIQALFLTALVKNLGNSSDQYRFMLKEPLVNPQSDEVMIKVQVYKGQDKLMLISFRLYNNGQNWKIFDVSANGMSAMLYYRQFLYQQIQQHTLEGFLGK